MRFKFDPRPLSRTLSLPEICRPRRWKIPFDSAVVLTMTTNIVFMILSLLAGVLGARILGPQGRGALAAIQLWPLLLSMFGHFGMPEASTYFVGRGPNDAGKILSVALAFSLVCSLPLLAVLYVLLPHLLAAQDAAIIRASRIFLFFVPLSLVVTICYSVLQGLQEFRLWNLMRLFYALLMLIGMLLAILIAHGQRPSPQLVSYAILVASIGLCVLYAFMTFRWVSGPFTLEFGRVFPMLRYGVVSALSSGPRQLNLRLDQLLIANMFQPTALGLYTVAASWSYGLAPLTWAIGAVAFPRLAASEQDNRWAIIRTTIRRAVFLSASLGVIQALVTPLGIVGLFGVEFAAAIPVAMVLVCASVFSSVNGVLGYCLHGLGRPQSVLYAESIGLGLTVAGLLTLLPMFGIMGAAIVSLVSYGVTLLALLFHLNYHKGSSVKAALMRMRREIVRRK